MDRNGSAIFLCTMSRSGRGGSFNVAVMDVSRRREMFSCCSCLALKRLRLFLTSQFEMGS